MTFYILRRLRIAWCGRRREEEKEEERNVTGGGGREHLFASYCREEKGRIEMGGMVVVVVVVGGYCHTQAHMLSYKNPAVVSE